MNLAIFATADNIKGIASFLKAAAPLQKEQVNGCFLMVHDEALDAVELSGLAKDLSASFKIAVSLPVSVSSILKPCGQVAALLAQFTLNAYTRYPGAWMIVDDHAIPKVSNFMQEAAKQHATYGGKMTGRGIQNPGSIQPMGPVVIELPSEDLKILRFASNDGWRIRGRYLFGNCGFGQIPPGEYLFSINGKGLTIAQEPVEGVVVDVSSSAPSKPVTQPFTDMTFVPRSPNPPSENTEFDNEFVEQCMGRVEPLNVALTHPPKQLIPPRIFTILDFPTKKDILDKAEEVTGTRPHHFTGNDTLLALINKTHQPA